MRIGVRMIAYDLRMIAMLIDKLPLVPWNVMTQLAILYAYIRTHTTQHIRNTYAHSYAHAYAGYTHVFIIVCAYEVRTYARVCICIRTPYAVLRIAYAVLRMSYAIYAVYTQCAYVNCVWKSVRSHTQPLSGQFY
jgi:hypothetical protein